MRSSGKLGKRGVWMLIIIAGLAFGGCVLRIAYLTLVQGDYYKEKANAEQLMVQKVSADRGSIYDRDMNVLAQSATVWRVTVDPSNIDEEMRNTVLNILSETLELDRAKLTDQLAENAQSKGLDVASGVDFDTKEALMARVEAEDLTNVVYVKAETKRFYPNGALASTVLGFTGTDGNGLFGLESRYDAALTGSDGKIITQKDGLMRRLDNAYEISYDVKPGVSLVLTLDSEIQRILEEALANALEETKAKNIYGIVMNPKTGALYAVANLPNYDPNDPFTVLYPSLETYFKTRGSAEEQKNPHYYAQMEQWKNKAVADYYYPGSVFKVFLVAGAYEEGVIDENTTYDCRGTIMVGDRSIKDYTPTGHGVETPETLLVNSCNTFSVHVGQMMGQDMYYKYFQSFGFTDKTNVDLPGESRPIVNVTYHDPNVSFTDSDLASASFGQSISLTPLQVVTAVSALANGGKLMQPYIVEKQIDQNGDLVSVTQPKVVRQVVSETTAKTVSGWMEKVVNDGTGKNAYVAGYHVAGKTGTSEKLGSSDTAYIASFSGFAPLDDPEIAVVIVIDEPQGDSYSGGAIAAPVGGEVIAQTLMHLEVTPDYTDEDPLIMTAAVPSLLGMTLGQVEEKLERYSYDVQIVGDGDTVLTQLPEPGTVTSVGGVVVLYTESGEREKTKVPDFDGLTVYDASSLATANGLNLKIAGSSADEWSIVAMKQDIPAGTEVDKGSLVTVTFRAGTTILD